MYHPVNYNYVQQRSWVTEEQRDIAKAKKHTAKNQRSSQPFLLRNHNSSFCHFQNTLWSWKWEMYICGDAVHTKIHILFSGMWSFLIKSNLFEYLSIWSCISHSRKYIFVYVYMILQLKKITSVGKVCNFSLQEKKSGFFCHDLNFILVQNVVPMI